MRRLIVMSLLLLGGCTASAPPTPSSATAGPASPALTPTDSPTPEASATPSVSSGVDLGEVVRKTQLSTQHGLTHQARGEMLLQHLLDAGRQKLMLRWEVWPQGMGIYDVTLTIEPLSALTSPTPSPTPVRRSSPFDPIPKRKTTGVRMTWTWDNKKQVCVPADEVTKKFLELKPSLSGQGLEAVLPVAWRSAPAPEAPTVTPEELATATPEPEVEPEPIQFTGFIGSGSERRAVLTRSGQTVSLKPGDELGDVTVKAMEDDELVVEYQGGTMRLTPGQSWIPGKL